MPLFNRAWRGYSNLKKNVESPQIGHPLTGQVLEATGSSVDPENVQMEDCQLKYDRGLWGRPLRSMKVVVAILDAFLQRCVTRMDVKNGCQEWMSRMDVKNGCQEWMSRKGLPILPSLICLL
jgi:hypothetical protein